MSDFDNFITNLTDHELAIFVEYRSHGFLEQSKGKIAKEIKNRKLTSEQLEIYCSKKLNTNSTKDIEKCSRCGSKLLFSETDYEEKSFGDFSSVEVSIETRRCRLCGFNADKEEPKYIFERIKRIFINNKNKRIINRNSI